MPSTIRGGVREILYTIIQKFKEKQEERKALLMQKINCLVTVTKFIENLDVHVDKSVLENVKQLKEVEETELACQTQTKYLEEVSSMTDISVSSLKRISNERKLNNGVFSTPGKKRPHKDTVSNLDSFDMMRIIEKHYTSLDQEGRLHPILRYLQTSGRFTTPITRAERDVLNLSASLSSKDSGDVSSSSVSRYITADAGRGRRGRRPASSLQQSQPGDRSTRARPSYKERARIRGTIGSIISLTVNKPWQPVMAMVRCALAAALLWVAHALPAGDATPAPLVVVRDTLDADSTSSAPATQPTTPPSAPPPLKLTHMQVRADVAMRFARTAVVTDVRNPADQAQEAAFRVLLPETAYISGFEMTVDGVTYKAYVKGKEEAKQIYDQAVSQGISAAHVAVKARDSNEFLVSLNMGPKSVVKFNLTYEELLVRRLGVYNLAINLLPGAPVANLSVVARVREARALTALRVPALRTGNEVDATQADPSNPIAVIERSADNLEATITFKPDLEEQRRLMQVYAEKIKEAQQSSRRYSNENARQDGVLGQFVVQYDVERPKNGDILVNDGYFVHFFAPEELPPLRKLVVFVLDTSGSMMDRKIAQLRAAMLAILHDLNPGDYFSIVEFNSGVKVHDLHEAGQEPPQQNSYYPFYGPSNDKPVTLVPPFSVSKENIDKAKVRINKLDASGGTNIAGALDVAINIVGKGVPRLPNPGDTGTTGAAGVSSPSGETGQTDASTEGLYNTSTEASHIINNDDDGEEKQELESIIVFLTDGEPTVGETDPRRLASRATEHNSGPRRAAIFALAFGEDADRTFLRKLSLRNGGFMRHIYEAADAALQLRDFYRQISSPLLDDVTFVYPPDQIKEGSLTKHSFRTYYAGSELVVAGRLSGQSAAAAPAPRVEAFCSAKDGGGKKRYVVYPRVPTAGPRERDEYPLERLWVYLTIRQLLDLKDASGAPASQDNEPEKTAQDLALKYGLVTPLTSLVVVKPNSTSTVDTQSVDGPNRVSYGSPLAAHNYLSSSSSSGTALSFASFSQAQALSTPLLQDGLLEEAADYSYIDEGDPGISGAAFLAARPGAPSTGGGPAPPAAGQAVWSTPHAPPALPGAGQAASPHPDPLQPYHLESYSWVRPLLDANADALVLSVNGTTVYLKLTKDNHAPREGSDAACARATDGGGPGVCVYLARCGGAATISAQHYTDIHCVIRQPHQPHQRFAGVCCAGAQVDRPSSRPARSTYAQLTPEL